MLVVKSLSHCSNHSNDDVFQAAPLTGVVQHQSAICPLRHSEGRSAHARVDCGQVIM